MGDDIRAMMQGFQKGDMAFQGMLPSASNMGGAAQPVDMAAPLIDGCYQQLSDLIDYLNQTRQQADANKVLGALKIISGLQVERSKRYADNAQQGPAMPNINAQGM